MTSKFRATNFVHKLEGIFSYSMLGVIVCSIACLAPYILAKIDVVGAAFSLRGREFRSADSRRDLNCTSDADIYYWQEGFLTHATCAALAGPHPDYLRGLAGFLSKKDCLFRITRSGLEDPSGTTLYVVGGPDLSVVQFMWLCAKDAQQYYRQSKTYPSSAEQAKTTYENPFTKKIMQPIFASASNDSNWLAPQQIGQISCLLKAADELDIRGSDGGGKWLVDSKTRRPFEIRLRQGVNTTEQELSPLNGLVKPSQDRFSFTYLVIDNINQLNTLNFMRSAISCVLWILFTCALANLFFQKRRKDDRQVLRALLVVFFLMALLSAWYGFALAIA